MNTLPSKFRPMGYVAAAGGLPRGYMEAEFLESTGTQYINTGLKSTGSMRFEVNVESVSWGWLAYIFGSEQKAKNVVLSLNYANGNSTAGAYRYGTQFTYFEYGVHKLNTRYNYVLDAGKAYRNGKLVRTFEKEDFTSSLNVLLFGSIHDNTSLQFSGKCRIWDFAIEDNGVSLLSFIPALDSNGGPCMFDKVTRKPFYNRGTGAFIVGMTREQARKLSKLPKAGGSLTVSLPWEAGVDAEVQEALAKAAAAGWTVVVQYREPEVATENIEVDFLESTGTQYVKTGVPDGQGYSLNVEFVLKLSDNDRKLFGGIRTGLSVYAGQFRYNVMRAYVGKRYLFEGAGEEYQAGGGMSLPASKATVTDLTTGKATSGFFWVANKKANASQIALFAQHDGTAFHSASYMRIYYAKVRQGGEILNSFAPGLDASGVPCMQDSVSGRNFYNSGSGAFIAGFESTEKAALGLAKLPVVEAGELTVSLPAAAQEEATRVPAAIEVARQRGWTIITQYREN